METEKQIEYRMESLIYEGKTQYIITKSKNGGKFRFCFGGLSYQDASNYLKEPKRIESAILGYKIIGYLIILPIVLFTLFKIITE